ncbi:MAG TPA: GxxExxY protein [Candidatus Acidoferrales bacterium]|nr:GxxExxY protein [Candidatus Acidoferrales bacterium]
MEEKDRLDSITRRIIGAAIEVHRHLGPGLLESAYQVCLAHELREAGLNVEEQKSLPVVYRDVKLDCGYRLDLVVEDSVVVEIKAVEHLVPIHDAQLFSYLRLSGKRAGLLINFHVRVLKNGLKRIVNEFPDAARSTMSRGEGRIETLSQSYSPPRSRRTPRGEREKQ